LTPSHHGQAVRHGLEDSQTEGLVSRWMGENVETVQDGRDVAPVAKKMNLRVHSPVGSALLQLLTHSVTHRVLGAGEYEVDGSLDPEQGQHGTEQLELTFCLTKAPDHADNRCVVRNPQLATKGVGGCVRSNRGIWRRVVCGVDAVARNTCGYGILVNEVADSQHGVRSSKSLDRS
jgi:hypothetical protein